MQGEKKIDTDTYYGRWIHDTVESECSSSGFFLLPRCQCSICMESQPHETPYCLNCGAIMDKPLMRSDEMANLEENQTKELQQLRVQNANLKRLLRIALEDIETCCLGNGAFVKVSYPYRETTTIETDVSATLTKKSWNF